MKDKVHTVKRTVYLTELQAQQLADLRDKFGAETDEEALRAVLDAMVEILRKDPKW